MLRFLHQRFLKKILKLWFFQEWEEKAKKDKERYEAENKKWLEEGGAEAIKQAKKAAKAAKSPKKSAGPKSKSKKSGGNDESGKWLLYYICIWKSISLQIDNQ